VLIVGASGYLGSEIGRQAARAGHVVVGTWFSSRREGLRRLDVRDADSVAELIANHRPDAVVNAAYAKGDWATTAVGPGHVAACCTQAGVRLVHISSEEGHLTAYFPC
jgi:dTDP-4-dehydrorhamnose reductase